MMNKIKRFLNQPIDTPLKRFVSLFVAMAMVLSVLTVTSLSSTTPASAAGDSSYKVTNDSNGNINLTIQHLNNGSEFYTADHQTLQPGGFIDNYNKVKNYTVTSVTLDKETVSDPHDLRLTTKGPHTIVVNYEASTSNVINPVKFYDYTLHPDDDKDSFKDGINDPRNYNNLGTTDDINWFGNPRSRGNRLAIGKNEVQDKNRTRYSGFYSKNGNATVNGAKFVEMNNYTGSKAGSIAGKDDRLGIIEKLTGTNYSVVNFNRNIYAPKLFSNDSNVLGLTNIDNYKLNFKRTGDTYRLTKVLDQNGDNANEKYTGNDNFFPLNNASKGITNDEDKENRNNNYFGMRYDFTFTLGDYNGPLNYTFNGDDDLWVFLDGELVLDDGGIHGAIEKEVDIKKKLGTNLDKSETHQITVLYMERGAGSSNCSMEFTIPNLTPINYQEPQTINVEFTKKGSDKKGSDNKALAGAEFTVVDENKISLGTFTSDNNGKVTLDDLRVGTYYVTETKAPEGYVLTGNVQYEIRVSRDNNGNLTYKLYQPGENNNWSELSDNTIYNKSEQEVEQESIDAKKTAELVKYGNGSDAWDQRLYDITLNPISKKTITTTSTTTTPGQEATYADIMLVLDVSGSMDDKYSEIAQKDMNTRKTYYIKVNGEYYKLNYDDYYGWYYNFYGRSYLLQTSDIVYEKTNTTKLDALKSAAIAFVNNMKKTSPESRVGLKAFSSSSYRSYEKSIGLGKVKDNYQNIINVINSLEAKGGTSPERGLGYEGDGSNDDALSQLTNDSNNLKFTILFTDGSPTGEKGVPNNGIDNEYYWDSKDNAENAARQVKNIPSTLYTVGFGMGTNATNWLKYKIASKPANAYTADTAESLSTIFNELSDEIASQTTTEVTEKKVDITDATVVDTIDARFVLTDKTSEELKKDPNVIITDNADGTTTVTWTNQTIKTDGSTKYVLRVKAKDGYFGGNNVATNVKDKSYIETGSGAKKEFDQPHVNVKAELTAKDYKTTRFAGETFNANSVEGKGNKSLGEILSPQYNMVGVEEEWKDANGNKTTLAAMNDIKTNAQYTLDLSYNASKPTDASSAASNGHVNHVNNDGNMTATGKFVINFKKGSLTITKKIDEQYTTGTTKLVELADNDSGLAVGLKKEERDTNDYTQSNQTFIYKIQRKVDNVVKETFYATISFDAKDGKKEKSVKIHNLEKGDYTVTEETDWSRKYSLMKASTNNGTTTYSFGSNSTTDGNNLKIGYREDTTKSYFTGLDDDANDNTGYVDTNDGYADTTFTKAVMTRDNKYVVNQDVKAIYTNNKKNNWYWNSDAAIAINKYN